MKTREWINLIIEKLAGELEIEAPGQLDIRLGANWYADMNMVSDHVDRHGMYSIVQTDTIADLITQWLNNRGIIVPDYERGTGATGIKIAFFDETPGWKDYETIGKAISSALKRIGYNIDHSMSRSLGYGHFYMAKKNTETEA